MQSAAAGKRERERGKEYTHTRVSRPPLAHTVVGSSRVRWLTDCDRVRILEDLLEGLAREASGDTAQRVRVIVPHLVAGARARAQLLQVLGRVDRVLVQVDDDAVVVAVAAARRGGLVLFSELVRRPLLPARHRCRQHRQPGGQRRW